MRQFIEMVNGTDSEVRCLGGRSPKSQDSYPGSPRPFGSPSHKPNSSQPYLSGTTQLCHICMCGDPTRLAAGFCRVPQRLCGGQVVQVDSSLSKLCCCFQDMTATVATA